MDSRQIGAFIRTRRRSRRVPQADLAELAGISVRTLREIEKGSANPELKTLMRICQVLGMRISVDIIT